MKHLALAALLSFAMTGPALAEPPPVVLTASATSSTPGSAPITCLLDPACQGTWTPGSLDYGIDEGIFLQFEQPVPASSVEVVLPVPNAVDVYGLKVYVNGKTKDSEGRYYIFKKDEINEGVLRVVRAERPYGMEIVPLRDPIKSLFIKIDSGPPSATEKVKIQKIRFIREGQPIAFALPLLQPAQVSASSALDPQTAYHPAHLFDAKTDFAWATDGKKTDGRGQFLRLQTAAPQNVAGLIVWNGYQRSETHFRSNGRVSKLEIKAANGPTQIVSLSDAMGAQRVALSLPLNGVSDLTMTIKDIIPGTKYKDVLLSEMRLITPQGQVILPQAVLPRPMPPTAWAPWVDRSLTSFLFQPVACSDCAERAYDANFLHQRVRLRSDGSFVVYKYEETQKTDAQASPLNQVADVLEGNWEPVPAGIRIFGKKHPTLLAVSEYLKEAAPSAEAAIFQSELRLKRYGELSPNERQGLFDRLWTAKRGPAAKNQGVRWDSCLLSEKYTQTDGNAFGADRGAVFQAWDRFLKGVNPYVVESTMLTDVFLPTEDVRDCSTGP